MEFYLDHNVARELAEHLRAAGHGAWTARRVGMERAGDEEQLSLAARSGWTLITHNAKDFSLLHAAWRLWSREWGVDARHGGVLILFPPVSPQRAAVGISALLETGPELLNELYEWQVARGWTRRS